MNGIYNSRKWKSGMVVTARSIRMNMGMIAENCITKTRRRENLSWLYQAQKLGIRVNLSSVSKQELYIESA
jgi:hypothetical protein